MISALAWAANPKVAPDLANWKGAVIVRYKAHMQDQHHRRIEQRGGHLNRTLEVVNSAAYQIPAAALEEVANDPDVEYITPDRPVKAMLDYAEPTVNANIAFQSGWTGAGVTVAVIDSGIMDTHPDLQTGGKSRVVYAADFNPTVGNDYFDRFGHGTHVAGILGGNGAMSTGPGYTHTFLGIAPNVRLVNLRVLDQNGAGTDSMVIAAIQGAISLKSTYNIRIINLSLGRAVFESYTLDPLCQAVEQAWNAGIVVVVAAGNEGRNNSAGTSGYGTITSPGNDPYVITVGAMKDMKTLPRGDDQMASYSSKGPTLFDHVVKPDIVAPGNKINAALPAGLALTNSYPGNQVPWTYYEAAGNAGGSTYYFTLSGTSMATPMVSGAAALLLQKHPSLTPDQVKARANVYHSAAL
jgi:serine protease AprX